MLTKIGKRPQLDAAEDAVALFLDCHERIRAFVALARRLGEPAAGDAAAIRDAAARVHRYFTEALPLHARDEEESLLPRLRGLDPAVDAELAEMSREHGEHGRPLRSLLEACGAIVSDPELHGALAPVIAAAAEELDRHFVEHLRREEEVIFPAVRRLLDARADAEIVRELRARRGVHAPPADGARSAG